MTVNEELTTEQKEQCRQCERMVRAAFDTVPLNERVSLLKFAMVHFFVLGRLDGIHTGDMEAMLHDYFDRVKDELHEWNEKYAVPTMKLNSATNPHVVHKTVQ